MFLVKAKTTMVVIGTLVFSPVLATKFEELPPEVAERDDLLLIEEVLDEQPEVVLGGLSATGTLEAGGGAPSGADTGADSEPDGQGQGEGASDDPGANTGADSADGAAVGQGPALDSQVLTDEALASGVTIVNVGDDAGESAQALDPFADPADALAPKAQPSGRGGRGGRK